MDLGGLRALALELNLSAHGVDVTIWQDGGPDIVTRGIWLTMVTEDLPGGIEFQRREPIRVMVLPRSAVLAIPRGTTILGPEVMGGTVKAWKVDGLAGAQADQWRVTVLPDPEVALLLGLEV